MDRKPFPDPKAVRLKSEEFQEIAAQLRKILTHQGLEKLLASHETFRQYDLAWRDRCDLQEQLIEAYGAQAKSGLAESYIESLNKANDALQAVVENQKKLIEGQEREIQGLDQAALYSMAIQESAYYYAVLCRSTMVYVLERSERGKDWLRLWDALPEDQKEVYHQESRDWFGKQPTRADAETKKMLKRPPKRTEEGNQDEG